MQQLLAMAAVSDAVPSPFFTVLPFIIHHCFIFLSFYQVITPYLAHSRLQYCESSHHPSLVNLRPAYASHLVSDFQRFMVFLPAPLTYDASSWYSAAISGPGRPLDLAWVFVWIRSTQCEWEVWGRRRGFSADDWLTVGLDRPCFDMFQPFWPSRAQGQFGYPASACVRANSSTSFSETQYKIFPGLVIPSASLSLGEEMPLTRTFVTFDTRNPLVGCLFFSLLIYPKIQTTSSGIFHWHIFKLLPSLKAISPLIIEILVKKIWIMQMVFWMRCTSSMKETLEIRQPC